jgi:ParB family transcriptional regulator, chromosome partitioning protein
MAIRTALACRNIVQAVLCEEEWGDADREFNLIIREGLEDLRKGEKDGVAVNNQLVQVPVDKLMVDPNQPRRVWVQSKIDDMAASIAARGVLQPLRAIWDEERESWRIVTGESRWRAAKQAGLATVPCLPVEGSLSETDILSDQIVENHCRSDLRPLDLARAMSRLRKLKSCTAQDLAAELGISGASVTRAEALLTLPPDVQAMVDDGRLAESAAYELSRLKDEDAIRALAHQIVASRLNRDQVIEAVRLKVGKKNVTPRAGRVTGKLDGVSFTFTLSGGELTPEMLLGAIEKIRAKLKELQRGDHKDVSALPDLLRAS